MLAHWSGSQAHVVTSVVDRGEARYCASKLLVLMHARHLAKELSPIGVVAFNRALFRERKSGAIEIGCSNSGGNI